MEKAEAIQKKIKTLSVNGKEFKISFISTYTHMKIRELNQAQIDAEKLLKKYNNLLEKNPENLIEMAEIKKQMEEINNRDVISGRLDLIKHILEECNDIEFDEKFWQRKTRVIDINNFLYDCLYKDWDKKKAPEEDK